MVRVRQMEGDFLKYPFSGTYNLQAVQTENKCGPPWISQLKSPCGQCGRSNDGEQPWTSHFGLIGSKMN